MSKVITVTFPGGREVDANIANTIIHTDQSVRNGGGAKYPEPFQLFLASIATCAGTYALDVFIEHGLSMDNVSLAVTVEWNSEKRICDVITMVLTVPADFPKQYREHIIAEMKGCTVTRHLSSEITCTIEVKSE